MVSKDEEKLINALNTAKTAKDQGNNFYKAKDYKKAEEYYRYGKQIAEEYFNSNNITQSENFNKLAEETVMLNSNLCQVLLTKGSLTEVFCIDNYILTNLNPLWDKSYYRLIIYFMTKKQYKKANDFVELMKKKFSKEILDKYTLIFEEVKSKF